MTTNPWARMNSGKAVSAQQTTLLEVETMATKRRQQATKRKSGPMEVERRTLRPKLLRVDLREELIARPAVSPGLYRRPEVAKRLTKAKIGQVVQRAGVKPMGGGGGLETHVELSPAVPWVDGSGGLEAAGTLQSYPQIAPIAQIHRRVFSDISLQCDESRRDILSVVFRQPA